MRSFASEIEFDSADEFQLGISDVERTLVSAFPKFCFVAIDNTTSPGITAGMLRIKTSDCVWRNVVEELSASAVAVIINSSGNTPGLEEELSRFLSSDCSTPTIVLLSLYEQRGDATHGKSIDAALRKCSPPEGKVAVLIHKHRNETDVIFADRGTRTFDYEPAIRSFLSTALSEVALMPAKSNYWK